MFPNFAKIALIGFLFVSLLSISPPAAAKDYFVGDFNGDEDGNEDFVITGPWGLGILTWDTNDSFVPVMMKPNGTVFEGGGGTWPLDTKGDKVRAVGDFNGDGRADLLMTSSWGMGIFTLEGDTLKGLYAREWGTLPFADDSDDIRVGDFNGDGQADILITHYTQKFTGFVSIQTLLPIGPVLGQIAFVAHLENLGGWQYNILENRFQGIGNFDNDEDGRDDILITSNDGIGVLTLSDGTLTTLAVEQNDTDHTDNPDRIWTINTQDSRIHGVGDIDGDGSAEFIMSNDWGVAVLGVGAGTFVEKTVVENGTQLGNWQLNSRTDSDGGADHIWGIADLNGDDGDEILVTSPSGLGVLTWGGGQLTSLVTAPNGTFLGQWNLNSKDNTFCLFGNFVGGAGHEVIVKSPWGIGLLTLEYEGEPNTLESVVAKPNDTRFGLNPGWLYAGWKNSLPHGLFGCGVHPDTECAYGDPACSRCVDGLLTYIQKIDLNNKLSEYGIRTGKKRNIHPDKDYHIQGAARLADFKDENGISIGRMILTFNGVFGPEGLMYVEQEGNDSEEAVYVNNVAEPIGDNIDIRHSGAHAFEHPGGAQAHGDTVAVSMGAGEGDVKAGVHFLRFPPGDQTGSIISSLYFDGLNGEPDTLPQPTNVNAAGFLQLASGQYLLAVAGNKGESGTTRIYFYKGRQEYNTPGTPQPQTPINGTTKWRYLDHFDPGCDGGGRKEAGQCFSGAQTLSLLADCKGKVQLLTMNGSGELTNNSQWYQLYDLNLRESGKVEMKLRMWKDGDTGNFKDDSFRYGAGTYIDKNRFLLMFNAERRTKGVKPKGQVNGEVYLAQ